MPIEKFTKIQSSAVPLDIENIDTDQIIPARFLKAVERKGFGDNLFRDWRFDKSNKLINTFPLNDSKYTGQILIGGKILDVDQAESTQLGHFMIMDLR